MPDRHKRRILPNLVAGIILITAGILILLYLPESELPGSDRKMLIIAIIVAINGGLYFWGNAIVHKIKSDLIRKQRHRDYKSHEEEI